MAEKKECEKSQNIVDEASEKEKKESLNQEPEVSEETGSEEGVSESVHGNVVWNQMRLKF